MNTNDRSTGNDKARDDVLESLFSHVPARKKAPEEDEKAIREALHSEWRDLNRRRNRRRLFKYGIAASLFLGAIVSFNIIRQEPPVAVLEQVARVEKQSGNIFIHTSSEQFSEARRLANSSLFAGQVLSTTQDARMAIEMDGGESIRLDENSRLTFVSGQEIELISGRIYVDSHLPNGQASSIDALVISTFAGSIQHLGTQYIAVIENSTVAVSVREGRVLLSSDNSESYADPGQQVSLNENGETEIISIPTHGSLWEWTELVTPEFNLDGRSAFDFIHWVGRETGRQVSYATIEAEQLARSTELRGTIDLEPLRALDLILQTSDLEPLVNEGDITISAKKEA